MSSAVASDTRHWGEQGGSYSDDGQYRWSYERRIGDGPTICWIGLNPGTGDREGRYRPTLQRMVDRSVALEMGRIVLVNLFAWRATRPADLRDAHWRGKDIIGAECDAAIRSAVRGAELVIAAWGGHGSLLERDVAVTSIIGKARCLGTTAKGNPRHPLYVPSTQRLLPFP